MAQLVGRLFVLAGAVAFGIAAWIAWGGPEALVLAAVGGLVLAAGILLGST